ncbi:MAG: ankyrin repeat domain-containing protein [Alphaproteobacteria bacterium]|nr:ankyrin repeat domain-containing protein [Alphaproteobacteria bacterium]
MEPDTVQKEPPSKIRGRALLQELSNGQACNTSMCMGLIISGVDVNETTRRGLTALALAVKNNHTEIAKMLLSRGANPNVRCNDLTAATVLIRAVQKGNLDIVKALLDHGASIELDNKIGINALKAAKDSKRKDILKLVEETKTRRDIERADANGTPKKRKIHRRLRAGLIIAL